VEIYSNPGMADRMKLKSHKKGKGASALYVETVPLALIRQRRPMRSLKVLFFWVLLLLTIMIQSSPAQTAPPRPNDSNTPLHLLKPDYPVPYGPVKIEQVIEVLERVRNYLETSATAIFTYSIAHAINQGWIDPLAHGPMALLGWNAVSTKVNAQGQVEGTCVGTGMGFDPAFYYHRPTNVFAAHGYGPVILAGAEIIKLLKNYRVEINDSSVQFYRRTR
jgi:hypothetical protein